MATGDRTTSNDPADRVKLADGTWAPFVVLVNADGTFGSGSGASSLGKAEDAVHTTGDVGIMALGVRADTAAATAANGDYTPFLTDGSGRVWAHVAAIDASEVHLGQVGGTTTVIKPTITVDTGIYAALDILGALVVSGVVTLTGAVRVSGGTGVLQSVTVFDDDNEKNPITLLFFDAAPASGTYIGNAALALSAGDKAKYIGRVDILASDYVTMGGEAFASIRNIGLPVKAVGTANLFMIPLVTSGTPTYTAATDIQMAIGFLQD